MNKLRFFKSMRCLLFVLLLAACAGVAAAQQHPDARTALDALSPDARALATRADTTLVFRTRTVPAGRLDVEEGVLRAVYRPRPAAPAGAAPEVAAQAYLAAEAEAFGWSETLSDLALAEVQRGAYNTHLVYQQMLAGLPVYQRRVKVNLDREGRPTMVLSAYAPHLAEAPAFNPVPTLRADEAEAVARDLVATTGARTSTPELVAFPSKPARLAWRLLAWPDGVPAEWEVLVDAHSGDVLHLFDQSTHAHGEFGERASGRNGEMERGRNGERASGRIEEREKQREGGVRKKSFSASSLHLPDSPTPRLPVSPSLRLSLTQTQGSGLVFDPDPLTTAGVTYGGAYLDANDADVDVLNAERIEVVLNDITQGTDGLYRLQGPFVAMDGSAAIGGSSSEVPAEASPDGFRYTRADEAFEAVMVYYHVDKSQRYVQALSIGRPIQEVSVRVNPHGLGSSDNSRYFPGQNALAFGDGGIDDAEDADVIWHEYGHALLQGSAPGLLSTSEGQALHEGWADYWAASYSRFLAETNPSFQQDWRKVFTWDGNNGSWQGRWLDHQGQYPDDLTGNIYTDGLMWATTLMEIYDDVGREVIDRLNLASHGYLNAPATFADAAQALLQADRDYYDGAHLPVLIQTLGARGYVDQSVLGPMLVHEPISFVEHAGSEVTFDVIATAGTAELEGVSVFYQVNGESFQELPLQPAGDDRYTGTLTLPPHATEVTYYLEATDQLALKTRLPDAAPATTFSFEVGADTEAPQITHDAIQVAALQSWPAIVIAEASDNQAVDSVWVTFAIDGPDGASLIDGAFGLTLEDGRYIGTFPVEGGLLEEGATVRYQVHARDVSPNANETSFPADEPLVFPIIVEGVLAYYPFEAEQTLQASGVWGHGTPAYGLQVAHSGTGVWGTRLNGAYPAAAHQATLELPVFNLAGLDQAFLTFWHWYDVEHSGVTDPGEPADEALWDGGNVKVSTDGGASWTVLGPQGGYTGPLATGTGNPMAGEPVFGGYSFGWRRVVMPLPVQNNVRIRFDFGADSSNDLDALFYAGWFLDDVRIMTTVPVDDVLPVVLDAPPAVIAVDAGQLPPPLVVQAEDDVGIEAVLAEYEVIPASGSPSQDVVRLPMSLADLTTFIGSIAPPTSLDAGDRIEYRLRLRDFDGNTILYPASGEPPLRIEFQLAEAVNVLSHARTTGLWQPSGSGGYTATITGNALVERSGLVLEPQDLPSNTTSITLTLTHGYSLGEGLGGNVKASADGGATWQTLTPLDGYTGTLGGAGHPMQGEPIFTGQTSEAVAHRFDLSSFSGQQLRLRLDFGATRMPEANEVWRIDQAQVAYTTFDEGFDVPRELALHPNFPDPFNDDTTINYTLPESMPVRLELYNMLGQRISVLMDGEQDAGTHTLTMGRGSLASGVYFLRLMAGSTQKVERMVIAR